jgi:hypothetical protein
MVYNLICMKPANIKDINGNQKFTTEIIGEIDLPEKPATNDEIIFKDCYYQVVKAGYEVVADFCTSKLFVLFLASIPNKKNIN